MWRLALLALAVLPGLATPARADIICDGRDYAFRDGVRDDVMARSIGQGIMLRMGMATFEGATYFACVKAPGNGVLLAPADSNLGNIPSLNPSLQTVIYSIPGDSGRNVTSEEVTYIVGLFVRDAQLYLVYMTRSVNDSRVPVRIEGNRIFVQPLRKSENSQKLERYGKRYTINPQDDSNDLNYATVVSGDDGIYIHALYSNGPKGNVYLRTYFLADAAKGEDKFVKLSSDEGLPPERAGQLFSPTACDAVGTHELNAQGQLEEVHYIMWASLDRHIVMCRYLPHDAGKGALAYTTTPTPIPSTMAPSQSTFTLVEGNLKGAPYNDFGITLIEVGRLNQILIDHRALFYSTDTHSFVGSWINVNFPFNHSGAGLKAGSVSHWGIDRTDMKPEDDPEHGPDGTSFRKAMHQVFHLASISYEEGSSQFISSTILGNRFVTDESLGKGNNNGFIDLNTSDAIGSKDASHFHAWTLIGVIHGVPPYVPYDKEHPAAFPNLKFTFSASIASSTGISDSTEDSKEVSIAASTGGGVLNAVFSAEGSYTYGVKTADGTTTTDSVSSSKTASQTFNPVGDAKEFAPDSIGLLLYSAPRFVSKAYRIIRWDRGEFPGTKRNVFLTVVSNRSLQLVPYVLDHPELGPLTGSPRAYNPALKELTLGIAPVKPTSSLRDWRFTGPVPDIGKFPSFKNSNASITASLESAGDFAFNFVDTHSEGKTHLESKTNKSTLKVSGGIKGLFNVSVSGSSAGTSTFSTSSTFTTSLGTGIAGNYPLLWPQRIGTISVQANLVYPDSASADQKPAPTWIPDAFKGRCAPFLLTWSQVATDPPIAARKSWRLPRHHAYGEDATGE